MKWTVFSAKDGLMWLKPSPDQALPSSSAMSTSLAPCRQQGGRVKCDNLSSCRQDDGTIGLGSQPLQQYDHKSGLFL